MNKGLMGLVGTFTSTVLAIIRAIATAWMGDTTFAMSPVALYGALLLCIGIAYTLLKRALLALHGRDSVLVAAIGMDVKGLISLVIYSNPT